MNFIEACKLLEEKGGSIIRPITLHRRVSSIKDIWNNFEAIETEKFFLQDILAEDWEHIPD